MMRAALMMCAAAAALLAVGCNTSSCDRDQDSITVTTDQGVSAPGVWLSSPYHDPGQALVGTPYWHFPPARTITFEHHLGSLPVPHTIELAFTDHGPLAPGDGNEDIIECMDDDVIQIKNDTCSEFWVYVTTAASGVHNANPKTCFAKPNPHFGGAGDAAVSPAEGGAAGGADESAGAGGAP